jgi:hypothetical protein
VIELNGPQRRHLLGVARYVDRLLSEARRDLSGGGSSLFADCVPDATPAHLRWFDHMAGQVRALLRRSLAEAGVEVPPPRTGALWSARVHLTTAEIAASDLEGAAMRGYGPLTDEAVAELGRLAAELRSALRHAAGGLVPATGGERPPGQD